MSVPLSQVLTTARTYLNDDLGTQFPDQVLIPKVQEAHRELQEELWNIGSPLVRAQTAVLAYTTPAADLTTALVGVTDLLCPISIFENAPAATVASAGWAPLTEQFYLPLGITPGPNLIWWCWQKEVILVSPANANRTVIIQYRRQIPIPAAQNDLIGILFGESFLSARAAGMAAGTVGNADALAAMTALASSNLAKVLSANRGQQKSSMRP